MKVRNIYRSPVAIAAALVLSAFTYPVMAQTNTPAAPAAPAATSAKANAQEHDFLKLSQDGFQAMRDVRLARVAIFNGDPKVAGDLLANAKTSLDAAKKMAPEFVFDVQEMKKGKTVADSVVVDRLDTIPIDGRVALADNYIDSPAKRAHIEKANEHIAKGDGKSAADELRLAEVDASFSRVLMPISATTQHVAEASKLLGEQKFYESNLALKAAEDGLRIDSIVLSEIPAATGAAKQKG